MGRQQPARGELIARGNTSDLWAWTPSTVVKVLRPGIPRHWAALEADITRAVHEAGLPVPATDGVVEVDERPGLVLERIDGPSMWLRMKERPTTLPRLVEDLVDLQEQVLEIRSLKGIPELAGRLHAKIDEAVELPLGQRSEAHDLLASLPTGSALCHGDMHPANVLRSARGWVIVDWFDAAVGCPTADFARSCLMMPAPTAVSSASRHLDGVTAQLLGPLHDAYLAALARRGHLAADAFGAWAAVLAVARMAEPVQTADLHAVWQAWRGRPGTAVG